MGQTCCLLRIFSIFLIKKITDIYYIGTVCDPDSADSFCENLAAYCCCIFMLVNNHNKTTRSLHCLATVSQSEMVRNFDRKFHLRKSFLIKIFFSCKSGTSGSSINHINSFLDFINPLLLRGPFYSLITYSLGY